MDTLEDALGLFLGAAIAIFSHSCIIGGDNAVAIAAIATIYLFVLTSLTTMASTDGINRINTIGFFMFVGFLLTAILILAPRPGY